MTDAQNDPVQDFDAAVENFKAAAETLERAAAHCRIASKHFTDRDVRSGCAHAFAALGEIAMAREAIDQNARIHASKSLISMDPGRDT